ncbi:MAG: type II toxin-antitoxin system VapC family toxin [Deinococcota bacterium]|jgi:tRNA(fMet)-specific endonuclease VapC|nr:type II toxin-antitoxin system VapC family toxin [Deinococcota bacterium]
MTFLLDTDICIYLIRKKPQEVLQRFNAYAVGDIAVSSITAAELHFGVHKSRRPTQNAQALEHFLLPLTLLDFDARAAIAYGRLRAALEVQGTPIGALDTLIAAHALSSELTLVSNNVREFTRVPGLKVENWAEV